MSDLYLSRKIRLSTALRPLGFVEGKYGDLPYEAVEWSGVIDTVAFGFNIFVDGRLIATAAFYKDGREEIDMNLHQWLTEETQIVPPTDVASGDPQYELMKLWQTSDSRL